MMRRYFLKHKWNVLFWLFFLLIGVGIDIYGAFFIEDVTSTALSGDISRITTLVYIGALYVLVILIDNYMNQYCNRRLRQKCMKEMRDELFGKIMSLDQNTFNENNSAHYLSIITNDVQTSITEYIYNIPSIISKVILMITADAVLFYYNPILAVVDICVGMFAILVPQLTGKSLQEKQKKYSISQENMMNTAKDFFQGFSVLKSFNAEYKARQLYDEKTAEAAGQFFQVGLTQGITYSCSEAVTWFSFVVHTVLAAYLVLKGYMTLGTMLGATQVLNHVLNPIGQISRMMAETKAAKASNERIMGVLEMKSEEMQLGEIQNIFPIKLENVNVSYDEGEYVLNGISYTFDKGKKYAIVGASGSGKSTLLKVLLKNFPNYEGSLCYGELEAADTDRKSITDNISYIQQSVIIFNSSIRENITMFTDVDDVKLANIVSRAELDSVVARFPNGLDGMLDEEGKNLSGGERQRISIARAFLKESPVLLLDEATASLDNITARQIEESVLRDKNCMAIVITHKLEESILKKYDKILVLKHGKIVEEGTFEFLMDKKENFYSLFQMEN